MDLKTDDLLKGIAKVLNNKLLKGYGFALIVFDFNNTADADYVSNANRGDMIEVLRETANRLEKRQDIQPEQNN